METLLNLAPGRTAPDGIPSRMTPGHSTIEFRLPCQSPSGCDGEVHYDGPICLDENGRGTVMDVACTTCGDWHSVEYEKVAS